MLFPCDSLARLSKMESGCLPNGMFCYTSAANGAEVAVGRVFDSFVDLDCRLYFRVFDALPTANAIKGA